VIKGIPFKPIARVLALVQQKQLLTVHPSEREGHKISMEGHNKVYKLVKISINHFFHPHDVPNLYGFLA